MDGYYAWMLVATALVLLMTTPALALFYGGMSRSKSVLNMMMMSYVSMAIVGIVYVLWGWSMSFADGFSGDGQILPDKPFDLFGLDGVESGSYIFVLFQLTFAVITAALISGAIADRVKLSSWMIFLPIWVTLSYFPLAHMVFGGGLIGGEIGAQDYAGGTAVHINAGVAGLVLALIIGKRVGFGREPMKPHNLTLTMLGAGLLWFGWYGFNVGSIVFVNTTDSILAADPTLDPADTDKIQALVDAANTSQFLTETGVTFMNTTVATMAAILAWLLIERLLHGKATTLGAASGIVAGLVAITPACGAVDITGAIAIGAIAGAVCAWAVGLKYKFGLDDSLDVVGVHLVGGIIGTVLIGFFSVTEGKEGLFHGGNADSLIAQLQGAGIAILWSAVATAIIGYAIKYTIGWRVTAEEEVDGIDFSEHGETAYDLATSGGFGGGGSVLNKEGAH